MASLDHAFVRSTRPSLINGTIRFADKRFCFFPTSRANEMHRRKFAYDEELGVLLGIGLPASCVEIRNQRPDHIRKPRITLPPNVNPQLPILIRALHERVQPLAFDVNCADDAVRISSQHGHDDLRTRVSKGCQVVSVLCDVPDVHRSPLGNGSAGQPPCDGEDRVRWRAGTAPGEVGYLSEAGIDLVDPDPAVRPSSAESCPRSARPSPGGPRSGLPRDAIPPAG